MIKKLFWRVVKICTFSLIIQLPGYSHSAKAETNYVCVSQLENEINKVIKTPQWDRSRWGILVKTLPQQETIYTLDQNKYFLPASNVKLLTTAAALTELGPQFQIATPVYFTGEIPNLHSFIIVGKGDPTLSSDRLRQLARELKQQGIDSIDRLILVDSYLSKPEFHPTWEWSDLYYYYGAQVNSLILDENKVVLTITPKDLGQPPQLTWSNLNFLRKLDIDNQVIGVDGDRETEINLNGLWGNSQLQITGQIPIDSEPISYDLGIPDPNDYFLESFSRFLFVENIIVKKTTVTETAIENQGEVFTQILSPTLETIIRTINQDSNNLYAEAIAQIVEQHSGKTIPEILTELGVEPHSYQLADGSGLSRHNLVSPEAIVQTLILMSQSPHAEIYRDSLAIPGTRGTLSQRLINTELQAKTGYLTGVAALSGYLQPPDYQTVVFTVIVNQSDQSASDLKQAIDQIVTILNHLHRCQ